MKKLFFNQHRWSLRSLSHTSKSPASKHPNSIWLIYCYLRPLVQILGVHTNCWVFVKFLRVSISKKCRH